jgi:NAD-dependent dihydropyrimidine dehydrogenase PreA subunit
MKTFSSKSNARRALKSVGDKALERADQLLYKLADGTWGFDEELAELAQYAAVADTDIDFDAPSRIVGEFKGMNTDRCPDCGSTELYMGECQPGSGGIGLVINEDSVIGCHACGWEHREEKQASPKAKKEAGKVERVSTTVRPCQRVWEIADEMTKADPSVKRKAILDRCVAAGVAYNTARTQLQYFLTKK